MKKQITNYSDAGHSWFKVDRSELNELGLLDKISCFSYEKGNKVYLEEDCDAGLYFKAVIGSDNINYKDILDNFIVREVNSKNYSSIRKYNSYKAV